MGRGEGQGEGAGEDTGSDVAAGGGLAIGVTVCMCLCGIPMIIAGAVLVNIGVNILWTIGVVLISLAGLFLVVGVIFIILICSGAFGNKNTIQPQTLGTNQIIVSQQQQQQGMFMTPQSGYPPAQQVGYPPAPQAGYPPAPQTGYPPASQAGYPPAPQAGYPPAQQAGHNPSYPVGPQPNQQAGFLPNQPAAYEGPPGYSASVNQVQQPGESPAQSKPTNTFAGSSVPPPPTYN